MAAVRMDPGQRVHPRVLNDTSAERLGRLLDADPYVNASLAARLRVVGTMSPGRLGGQIIGCDDGCDVLGACFSGGNVLPLGGDSDLLDDFARVIVESPRVCTSIVGRSEALALMWPRISRAWGPPRVVRAAQPLLVTARQPAVAPHPQVRLAHRRDLDRYLPAAVSMFTEELGAPPHQAPGGIVAFRGRLNDLIIRERAFVWLDAQLRVVFKAEIGAVSAHTAQIQGVWVRPDMRGRGIATLALAAVFAHALTLAPTVSLYVNDFNIAARTVYERLGMQQVAELSTVLF